MLLTNWARNNEFFDDLPLAEFEALKKDISENGVINPLHVTPEGVVICGNQRLKACRALGIKDADIPTKVINLPENELLIYAIKDNILRRQLTPEQKAKPVAVMVKLLDEVDFGGQMGVNFDPFFIYICLPATHSSNIFPRYR